MAFPDGLPAIASAHLRLYQLYDISYSIDLEHARRSLLTPSAPARPVVSRGARIEIAQLPLEIRLSEHPITLGGRALRGQMQARVYDLGIVALSLVIALPTPLLWNEAIELVADAQAFPGEIAAVFAESLEGVRKRLEPAIDRPNKTVRSEDYTIFFIERLASGPPASALARHPMLLQVALGERKTLSAAASSLATSLSYYEDDLIFLTWSAAVIIEPDAEAREDAELLLEFANAQLLSLRSYDAEVERDMTRLAPRIARPRRLQWRALSSTGGFLREIYTLIADITETSARIENALKVTEDVYWNRVYSAALTILRIPVWQAGIDGALDVLRRTASLLHDETQAAWATLLEVLVIALIVIEIVVALLGIR
ncbi:MAG TPA: hypothetical protein VKT82_07025 [Ktedonobacterales bacterium]|nr:hypothetical protein [Ktedonobacterales bacterium]